MKKIAIAQSNYIPWKGYFDLIAAVDEFVLYDDAQYTRRDWRNRNRIKTPQGTQWLTAPVKVKGLYHQTIRATEIDGTDWANAHWRSLESNYRRAAHFGEVASVIEPLYRRGYLSLSELNRTFINAICGMLGIATRISDSADYKLAEGRNERLIGICEQAGAKIYVSGPAARGYADEAMFAARGIALHWFDYAGYPEYPQLWGDFVHEVTVLDLLFNCGADAARYMRYVDGSVARRTCNGDTARR